MREDRGREEVVLYQCWIMGAEMDDVMGQQKLAVSLLLTRSYPGSYPLSAIPLPTNLF